MDCRQEADYNRTLHCSIPTYPERNEVHFTFCSHLIFIFLQAPLAPEHIF
ncbi:hypothetical protein ASZ90_012530 [hydrocarbon metagenome]|uniref:Uncharacterized protein n=1 Tax=hydrocarbon metagenome TaxID=938273 RepID=A0A0W8FA97_9ZZZZ